MLQFSCSEGNPNRTFHKIIPLLRLNMGCLISDSAIKYSPLILLKGTESNLLHGGLLRIFRLLEGQQIALQLANYWGGNKHQKNPTYLVLKGNNILRHLRGRKTALTYLIYPFCCIYNPVYLIFKNDLNG